MRRLVRLAARLYPSWWRRRYAAEFEALLEDVNPGWRELADILIGALEMQLRTLATIPAVCALAGAIAGGFAAMLVPEVYAASATIRLTAPDAGNARAVPALDIRPPVERALGESGGEKKATRVTLLRGDSNQTTLTLIYTDRDPARAQRVAEKLSAAIVTGNSGSAMAAEVLARPSLPTSPVPHAYLRSIASGGVAGLVGGGVLVLLLGLGRRFAGVGRWAV